MLSSERNHLHMRQTITAAIAQLDHTLPGQAPLKDFVHHNTLHGFQHLAFPDALQSACQTTGAFAYLPESVFQAFFHAGRITRSDLSYVLDHSKAFRGDAGILAVDNQLYTERDIYVVALITPLTPVTGCQLNWQIEENFALTTFQADVPEVSRQNLLAQTKHESEALAIGALWQTCLQVLQLEHYFFHPEDLHDLAPHHAEQMLESVMAQETDAASGLVIDHMIRKETGQLMRLLFSKVGSDITFRGLIQDLTGEDIHDHFSSILIRQMSAFLDQGFSAWSAINREQGFYRCWKQQAGKDLNWIFGEFLDWNDQIQALPDDPMEAILTTLTHLGILETDWISYIERLCLEVPGWAGMFLWRHRKPGYEGLAHVDMQDYIAVRLCLERLYAQKMCREQWQIEPDLNVMRWYFRHHQAEFFVRYIFHTARLPEYIATQVQRLLAAHDPHHDDDPSWQHLAHVIWTWRQSPAADHVFGHTVYRSGWRLFRLAQHLGLCAEQVAGLTSTAINQIFTCIDQLTPHDRGFIWLQAYEHHYREEIFNALTNNHQRGLWADRKKRPEAQIVFCMDDREESFRRHLEELNPNIETLGAAGFFGFPINWKGLDDESVSSLCPVVVVPSHEIQEVATRDHQVRAQQHHHRIRLRKRLIDVLTQGTWRNVFSSALWIATVAPASLILLLGKLFTPLSVGQWLQSWRQHFDLTVKTRMTIDAEHPERAATPEHPRVGFNEDEQTDRVYNFLNMIGLSHGFSPIVVLMGHGSISQNNPHLAAYDCGACSGRHGGPNARVFAAVANRPVIRQRLSERGMTIPQDTWFVGAEHNTCDDTLIWYDEDEIPDTCQSQYAAFKNDMNVTTLKSAHERARRFASAPEHLSQQAALDHIMGRAVDFSQARPELGHANNAAAFIGRRSMSQGAFFDRRVFLISYDPNYDPDGRILEGILLAAGPVGAGINLEYYFSTVNNDQYGCGSKVTHNVTGLFGVMDGASSDLRTGLPKQMIEIHEAMRLQIVVEAKISTLTEIYQRQPPLQELIGNGWLLLSAKDPDSEALYTFDPEQGFTRWQGTVSPLPTVEQSTQWYQGHSGPLSPALIQH